MWQIPVVLGSLPIQVVFLHTGQVAFARGNAFHTIYEDTPKGVVIVSSESILVCGQELLYNRAYQLTENIKSWLKSFNLDSPV